MFNFFKKKIKPTQNQEKEKTRIQYQIDKEGSVVIDVLLSDYSTESIHDVSTILGSLSTPQTFLETVEFIKEGLIQAEEEDLLLEFLVRMSSLSQRLSDQNNKDEPCIKPSDML